MIHIYCDASVKLNSCISLVILNLKNAELETKIIPIKGNKISNSQLERIAITEAFKIAKDLKRKCYIFTDQRRIVRSYYEKKNDFYYEFINSLIESNKKIIIDYTSEKNPYMKMVDELSKSNHYKDNLFSHFIKFVKYIYHHKNHFVDVYNSYGIKPLFKGVLTVWKD